MEKFIGKYKLLKWTTEEIENPIFMKVIVILLKTLSTKKIQIHMSSPVNSSKYLRNNTNPSQTSPKHRKIGDTSELVLQDYQTVMPKL